MCVRVCMCNTNKTGTHWQKYCSTVLLMVKNFSLNMHSVCLCPVHAVYISAWTMNVCLGDIKLTWRWEDEENTNPHVWAVLEVTVYVSAWAHAGLQIVTMHGHLHSSAYLSEEGEMDPVKDEWWIKPDEWADTCGRSCARACTFTRNVRCIPLEFLKCLLRAGESFADLCQHLWVSQGSRT